jgi:protein-S-isoprenylcysteine O-methyltransferase Ste14
MSGDFVKRGGFWVVFQTGLMLANLAAPLWHRAKPGLPMILCSAPLFAVAAGCGILGALTLGRNLTPFPHPTTESRLVTRGIYALIRHPLYSAVMLWSLAWALLWLSWPAFVAALLLMLLLDAKSRKEERWLRQQFPDYEAYQNRTRRFLPRVY